MKKDQVTLENVQKVDLRIEWNSSYESLLEAMHLPSLQQHRVLARLYTILYEMCYFEGSSNL